MRKVFLSAVVSLSLLSRAVPGFAEAGSLDPAFGTGGLVQNSPLSNFSSAVVAPNGDIVVAGTIFAPTENITASAAIIRYLPNGTPDPSFGTNGIVMLPPPASFFLGESFTIGLAIQSNEEILANFYAFNNTSTESESELIRLNANGTPDTTFGDDGEVALNFPVPASWSASATLVMAQPDGKILVSGNITPPFKKGGSTSAPLTLLARYLSNGAPDTTFGSDGVEEVATSVDLPDALALLSGDGILAFDGGYAQFSSAGAPVSPVTGGTIVAINQPGGSTAIEPNGEYVVAESVKGPDGKTNTDATAERFEFNGTVDPTFNAPAFSFGPNAPGVKNGAAAIGVDSAGRVAVGVEFSSTSLASGVARLTSAGSLDTTFGNGGIGATVPNFVIYALLIQADNKIVMVSSAGNLARYLAQ
jgi:uncharacterized delta-60 repeat protein